VTAPINTYLSFKRVRRFPNDATQIAAGSSAAGISWTAGIDDGDHPALLVNYIPPGASEPVLLRLDWARLIDSLIAAERAEGDVWEPLRQSLDAQPGAELWGNSTYTVAVKRYGQDGDDHQVVHISYHRRDRAPVRDWRVGMRIKDQMAGEDWEAVEVYPARDRLVDTSNEYHLFAVPWELPFGFMKGEMATQDQIDEAHLHSESDGPVQRDDPYADTSGFDPADMDNPVRIPRRPATPYVPEFVPEEAQ
jgi:hypothetical protein